MRAKTAISVALGLVGVASTAFTYRAFRSEMDRADKRVSTGSRSISTSRGPIEYTSVGDGFPLLIIHGAGAEGWRSEQPKAKFVIINLPFKQIALRKFSMKKKQVMAIYAEEDSADRMSSTLFWDGKKYRYQPMGSTLD